MYEIHHTTLSHQNGVEGIIGEARKKYWMTGVRRLGQQVVKGCVRCAKKLWAPLERPLPPFHLSRTKSARAFLEIGIDHAGPFSLRQGWSVVQAQVLVVAYCATRAVNLEMSLSTGAKHVISALQRHVGVFGSPTYVNSDRGTGFVKAKRVLQANHELWRKEGWEMTGQLEWNMNPPYSPTWTGHVESMVKLVKKTLERLHTGPTITELNYDEFYTLLKRSQGYVNSQPLFATHRQHPIPTPADFIGTGESQLTNIIWNPEDVGRLGHRYGQLEEICREIWGVFREMYVGTLRRQPFKPLGAWRRVGEGDLVVTSEIPDWTGDGWPVARVVKEFVGEDGETRCYELEMVPAEELKKEPMLVNQKRRLVMHKKKIIKSHRKVGLLPGGRVHQDAKMTSINKKLGKIPPQDRKRRE